MKDLHNFELGCAWFIISVSIKVLNNPKFLVMSKVLAFILRLMVYYCCMQSFARLDEKGRVIEKCLYRAKAKP